MIFMYLSLVMVKGASNGRPLVASGRVKLDNLQERKYYSKDLQAGEGGTGSPKHWLIQSLRQHRCLAVSSETKTPGFGAFLLAEG